MSQADKIYEFMIKYIKNNNMSSNNEVKYYLKCARPLWFQNIQESYSVYAKSNIEALVHFYEQLKKDNVTMGNKNFNLIEYALDFLGDDCENVDDYELVRFVISFYFRPDGIYDCTLYIVNKNTKNINNDFKKLIY